MAGIEIIDQNIDLKIVRNNLIFGTYIAWKLNQEELISLLGGEKDRENRQRAVYQINLELLKKFPTEKEKEEWLRIPSKELGDKTPLEFILKDSL